MSSYQRNDFYPHYHGGSKTPLSYPVTMPQNRQNDMEDQYHKLSTAISSSFRCMGGNPDAMLAPFSSRKERKDIWEIDILNVPTLKMEHFKFFDDNFTAELTTYKDDYGNQKTCIQIPYVDNTVLQQQNLFNGNDPAIKHQYNSGIKILFQNEFVSILFVAILFLVLTWTTTNKQEWAMLVKMLVTSIISA